MNEVYPHIFSTVSDDYKAQYLHAMITKVVKEQKERKKRERKRFIKNYCLGKAGFCITIENGVEKKTIPEVVKLQEDCEEALHMYLSGFTLDEIIEKF